MIPSALKQLHLWSFLKSLRIEPLMLLFYINDGLSRVGFQVGKYRAICQQVLGPDNEYFDCLNPASSSQDGNYSTDLEFTKRAKDAEVMVQQANIFWNMMFTISYSVTALFGDTILAGLGDRYGRKNNILVGIVGTLVAAFPYLVLFTFPSTPLYIFLIANVIAGLTGYQSIISISFYAYLADSVVDHSNLTMRMTFLYSFAVLPNLITPPLSAAMLTVLSYARVELISECFLVLAFFLSLVILKQIPPKLMRKMASEKARNHVTTIRSQQDDQNESKNVDVRYGKYGSTLSDPEDPEKSDRRETKSNTNNLELPPIQNSKLSIFQDLQSIFKEFVVLMTEIYDTYRKPRPGRTRAYLLIITLVYCLHVMFETGARGNIVFPYVQKSPFLWGPKEIALFISVGAVLELAGTWVGIWLLKKIFKFRDTTIIILAMITHSAQLTTMAFAKTSAEFFAALGFSSLWGVIIPCVKSITTQLVDADEVGKSYILCGLSTTIGTLISSVAYDNIYIATVAYFPGFVFLLSAGLELTCVAALVWLHFDQKKKH